MRLGFAVKVLGGGGLPSHDSRRWRSEPHLRHSLVYLGDILDYLAERDLRMYRMATGLAPYASHPELPQFTRRSTSVPTSSPPLAPGRVSWESGCLTHPGQYTVLNSERPEVVSAAVAELEVQARLLDGMGQPPEAVVVVHVGGAAGGKEAGADRFAAGFERLSEAARSRVVLENDDRLYSLTDVLDLSGRLGVPLVWDVLHHHCHNPEGVPARDALALALATWPAGVLPKIHYSSPRLRRDRAKEEERPPGRAQLRPSRSRAHADTVDAMAFAGFLRHDAAGLDFDVMIEAKAKDLAVLRLMEQIGSGA